MREHAVGILGSTKMSINHSGRACIACDYHSMSMSMVIRGSLSAVQCAGLPMWGGILQGYGRQFRVIVGVTYLPLSAASCPMTLRVAQCQHQPLLLTSNPLALALESSQEILPSTWRTVCFSHRTRL